MLNGGVKIQTHEKLIYLCVAVIASSVCQVPFLCAAVHSLHAVQSSANYPASRLCVTGLHFDMQTVR